MDEVLAVRVLVGLSRCWTELDRVCAEWEGRDPQPVTTGDVMAAIRRVRADEWRVEVAAAKRRHRPRRRKRRRPRVVLVTEPPPTLGPIRCRPVWDGRQMRWQPVEEAVATLEG